MTSFRLPPVALRVMGVVAVGLFLAINLLNAWRKGGDFDDYFGAGRRLIEGTPLYAGSASAFGFVGPPAQALLFAPFALFDPQTAKLLWFVLNVVLLWWALATWLGILFPTPTPANELPPELAQTHADTRDAVPEGMSSTDVVFVGWQPAWRAGLGRFVSTWGVLPILAVAAPLQSQFEHQNLNVILLALAAWGTRAVLLQRDDEAGLALGIAAAIKVYPGLVLIWLAGRRQWRALGAGVVTVLAIGAAPVLFRGVDGFVADLHDWQTLTAGGWPTRRANQSVAAMWGRYVLGERAEGYPTLTFDHPLVLWLTIATALLLLTPLVVAVCRGPGHRLGLVEEIVGVNAVAILLSPIAWEHYFVGFFPLFLWLGLHARRPRVDDGGRRMAGRRRWAAIAFWVGFAAFTVLSRPVVGAEGARLLRGWSVQTWAGVLMCTTLATMLASRRWTATARLRLATRRIPEIPQADDGHGWHRRLAGGGARRLLRRLGLRV